MVDGITVGMVEGITVGMVEGITVGIVDGLIERVGSVGSDVGTITTGAIVGTVLAASESIDGVVDGAMDSPIEGEVDSVIDGELEGLVEVDVDGAFEGADVVMMLRVQGERGAGSYFPSVREYVKLFAINKDIFSLAKDSAIIMHPGPINRDVEIETSLADCDRLRRLNPLIAGREPVGERFDRTLLRRHAQRRRPRRLRTDS